ncbi:MAG TPA: hypothetical protein VKT78_16620 [Fimbriimonadaceae bacterium]|nr:hypothetical protein [Fimbriimonadaceae bacterium]
MTVLSEELRQRKLQILSESEGLSAEELAQAALLDGVCAAICIREGCDYTTEMEPDQDRGYCEVCGHNCVQSCLVLMGII